MVAEKGAKRKAKEGEAPKDESKAKEVEKEFTEAYEEVKKEVEALVRPLQLSFSPSLPLTRFILAGERRPHLLNVAVFPVARRCWRRSGLTKTVDLLLLFRRPISTPLPLSFAYFSVGRLVAAVAPVPPSLYFCPLSLRAAKAYVVHYLYILVLQSSEKVSRRERKAEGKRTRLLHFPAGRPDPSCGALRDVEVPN